MDNNENNDGALDGRRAESYDSEKSESFAEPDGMPKGPENMSNTLTMRNGVPGIFAPDVRRNNVDGPTASSGYDDCSTNLTGETRGNVTEIPAVITAGAGAGVKGERSRNFSSSSSNYSPSILSASFLCGNSSTSDCDESYDLWDEAKSENIMFGENGSCACDADGGEDENGNCAMDRPELNSIKKQIADRRKFQRYGYSSKTKIQSVEHVVELSTPATEKKWSEFNKTELQFLHGQFSEVLPRIFYDVVRKRVKDPLHYMVLCLIKYKVDKSMNVKTRNDFY